MKNVTTEQLRILIEEKLTSVDVPQAAAKIVADVLAYADERDIRSHGISRLPHYINRIQQGSIKANPEMSFEQVGPVISKLDGNHGLGHFIAYKAMEKAIVTAEQSGIGVVIVNHTSHSGAVGYYAHQAAKQNMIGLLFTQADALVAPFGGKEPFLGANPIAFGSPTGDGPPIVLDMSTSEVAFGKVMLAREANRKIPLNWGIDSDGNATDDPHAVHALFPMSGAKGFGLSILVDVLAGILAGANYGRNVEPMYRDAKKPRNLGQFFIAINPAFFIGKDAFLAAVRSMREEIHSCPPLNGVEGVLLPGEHSYEKAKKSFEHGIDLSDESYQFLTEENA